MNKYAPVEGESHHAYETALCGPDLRIRYILTEIALGTPTQAAVVLQVRMESGTWREAFREGEAVKGSKWSALQGALFRGLFRLWVRFGEVAHGDLVALCRWEVGAQELRGRQQP